MTSTELVGEGLSRRPKRADARRNYEALLEAARDAFAEAGASTSLEDIARRAGVGIGTLYRHFPTRQDLFEAVYLNEVDALCASITEFEDLSPWDALVAWLHRFVAYAVTKRAIAEQLVASGSGPSEIFGRCRVAIYRVGEQLLQSAQATGEARSDTTFDDVVRLISGITMIQSVEPAQFERVLGMAFDGLRSRS